VQIEVFCGACTTTQLTPAGKRQEKTKENEGTSLKTGGKRRKMEERQEKGRKQLQKMKENR